MNGNPDTQTLMLAVVMEIVYNYIYIFCRFNDCMDASGHAVTHPIGRLTFITIEDKAQVLLIIQQLYYVQGFQ